MITVVQLADWIVEHRDKGKAFIGYSYDKILEELLVGAENNSMICITTNGHIDGVVCGVFDYFRNVFYVYDVLCIKKGTFKVMMKYFKQNWPTFTLEGRRKNGKVIAYTNVDKLINLVR